MLIKRLIINGTQYPLAVNQSGKGIPNEQTEGSIGGLYMDTETGTLYKCTAAGDEGFIWAPALDGLEAQYRNSSLAGKTCVCFGDWVTACREAPGDYPSVLGRITGMTVINGAIGPGRMASKSEAYLEPFCMFSLADAVATGDWSAQDEKIELMYNDPCAAQRLEALKQVDWSNVDFVTIAHGGNDYADSVSLYEFRMALNYTIEKLLGAWPHLRILLLTPVWRWWPGENLDGETKSIDSNTLLGFRSEIQDAGSRYRIPVLDLLKTLGFNSLTKGYYFPENEGRDPNETGQEAIGRKIAAAMLSEF